MVHYRADQHAEALRVAIQEIRSLSEQLKNSEAYVLVRRATSLLEASLLEIDPRSSEARKDRVFRKPW